VTRQRVTVEGLATVRRQLADLGNAEARAELRDGLKAAAEVVAEDARQRVPKGETGRTRASVRATAGGNRAFVRGGRSTVKHYGWLDFGVRTPITGRPRSVGPWAESGRGPRGGRFIYPALEATRNEVVERVDGAMSKAVRALGLD
jgi:hypothetical protein